VMQMAAMGAVSSPMRGEPWQWWWWLLLAGCWAPVSGPCRSSLACQGCSMCECSMGVSLLCDAFRLQLVAHMRRGVVSATCDLSATPSTQVVSVRSVVSDARGPSITSMVQCRCWVSADQSRSITPMEPRAGLSLWCVLRTLPCDHCAWVAMSILIGQLPPSFVGWPLFSPRSCVLSVCVFLFLLLSCNPRVLWFI
jgi:hypothetical protein